MDDNSFHITETLHHRVFRIKEIIEEVKTEEVKTEVKTEEVKTEEVKTEEVETEEVKTKNEKPIYKKVEFNTPTKEPVKKVEPKKAESKKVEPKKVEPPKKIKVEIEDVVKTPTKRMTLGRKREETKNIDDILEEIYFDISIIDRERDIIKAMEYIMDFSMKYIDCDSGSTYLIDMDKNDFWFAAIRGPKADLLRSLNLRIPVGVGMAGFAMHENLTLAISDVNRDPRFYKSISDKLGYPTYSMVTVPMHANGRVYGAIQLINKKKNNTFTIGEINILDYIATHAAKYLDRKFNILNNFS